MLGTIYAVTTLAGWGMYITAAAGMSNKLNREGYKLVKDDKPIPEKIVDLEKEKLKIEKVKDCIEVGLFY